MKNVSGIWFVPLLLLHQGSSFFNREMGRINCSRIERTASFGHVYVQQMNEQLVTQSISVTLRCSGSAPSFQAGLYISRPVVSRFSNPPLTAFLALHSFLQAIYIERSRSPERLRGLAYQTAGGNKAARPFNSKPLPITGRGDMKRPQTADK